MAITRQKEFTKTCEKCGKNYRLIKKIYSMKLDARAEDYYNCPYCNEKIVVKVSGDEEIIGVFKIDE